MFSLQSGHGLKGLGIIHALVAGVLLFLVFFADPLSFMSSGIPYASFELFLLSWWLWRFPKIELFRDQMLPLSQKGQPMTTEQYEHYLHRAWRLQLLFVILWGWICAILFGAVTQWLVFFGGYPWTSVLLLGGIVMAIVGWIVGGAWIVHRVYGG